MNGFVPGSLLDLDCRERAIGNSARAFCLEKLEQRFAHLHGGFEIFFLHAPTAVVSATTLHARNFSARNELHEFLGFEPDVLSFEMARLVVADLADGLREPQIESALCVHGY